MNLKERILKQIELLSDEMVELCQALVRVNTVNPYSGDANPGNETNGQVILKPILEEMGAAVRTFETPVGIYEMMGVIGPKNREFAERQNLVAEFDFGSGGKRVILNGHMDTVSTTGMKIEPFSGEVKDGKIWGRGTSDCKGNLATALTAIRALLPFADELSGSIVYESVADEECSGSGAGTLTCCYEGYKGDMAVVVDGSGLKITYGCGGCLTSDIIVSGEGGHAARGGISAIDKALVVKEAIDNLKRERESANPDSKLNLGIFNSGVHSAVVPSSAHMSLNLVYALEEARKAEADGQGFGGREIRDDFERRIRQREERDVWLKEHPSQIEWVKDLLPFETPMTDPLVQDLREAYVRMIASEPEMGKTNAWLDASWLNHFAGTPVVAFGAGKTGTAHADVEYIVIDDMKTSAKVLAYFLYQQLTK